MIACVFLGPTLHLDEARRIFPRAVFRPPAEQGDLLAAVDQDRAELVGLIDGTFHNNLSVWHNEVCYLLSRGITVVGASSMGALRAVETECFGTIGVGTIFRWYRDGVIAGDDEVALLHGSEESGFVPMSVPLVNVRASLTHAVSTGGLGHGCAETVLRVAQSLYYPDRLVTTILQGCEDSGVLPDDLGKIKRALTTDAVDLKGS